MNFLKFRLSLNPNVFFEAEFFEVTNPFKNWVENLPAVAQWLVEDAKANGIVDDASFLEREKKLDVELRRHFWVARHVASLKDAWCLLDHVSSLPGWLRATPLVDLLPTVRQSNVFKEHGLTQVSDLDVLGLEGLLHLDRMGARSVRQLNDMLANKLLGGPKLATSKTKRSNAWSSSKKKGQLFVGVDSALSVLKARSRGVIRDRMGLSSEPKSLASIAHEISVTKETVRLIEKNSCRRIASHQVFSVFFAKSFSLVRSHGGWLEISEIPVLDEWFFGIEDRFSLADFILSRLAPNAGLFFIPKSKFDGVYPKKNSLKFKEKYYISEFSLDRLLAISRKCQDEVRNALKENLCDTALRISIRSLIPSELTGMFEVFYERATRHTQFSSANKHLDATEKMDAALVKILQSSRTPLPWKEIEKRLDPALVTARSRLKARLLSCAIVFGRNRYGLMAHSPLSEDQIARVRTIVENFVETQPFDRQWHSQEFLDVCVAEGDAFSSQLSMYLVNIALSKSDLLEHLGRLVWIRKDAKSLVTPARVGLQKTIQALLMESPGPMSTHEIKEKIKTIRGIGPAFQIFPGRGIVKVGKSLWNLESRT